MGGAHVDRPQVCRIDPPVEDPPARECERVWNLLLDDATGSQRCRGLYPEPGQM